MSRHTDHSSDDNQSPIYQAHPPAYTYIHTAFPIPHSHSITINPSAAPSSSSSLSSPALLPSLSPTHPKKKSLQVTWHPSVNQRQAEKRNGRAALLLAVILFFSSVTLLLFHFSGCDIATGQCQRLRKSELSSSSSSGSPLSLPSHGRKRLPNPNSGNMYGGEAWMMDQDGLVAGSAGRSRSGNEKPWNPYGRSSMSSSKSNENAQDQAGSESSVDNQSGDFSDALDQDYMGSLDMEIDDNTDEEDNDTEEYFEDDEYEMDESNEDDDEETGLGENDQDEDNFLMGLTTGATPQKAYIDIWNEGSDTLLSEDDYLELEDDYQTVSKTGGSQQSLIRSLDPNTNYMTYLPYAGLTNQLYGMLRAIMVAKSLGRTLILPPITTSSHDNSKQNQPWSDYFDLETFKQLSGVDLVELKDLRQTDRVSAVEDLKCHVTCGFGSLRPLDFTAKEFLRQWKFDLSMTQFEIETTEFNELVPALRSQENEHMLCITNGYKIAVPDKDEWDLYGRYFYFTPTIDQFFAAALEKLSARNQLQQQQHRFYNRDQDGSRKYVEDGDGSEQHLTDIDQSVDTNDQPYEHMNSALSTNTRLYNNNHATLNGLSPVPPHGPFISIHARRGDFVEYCQQQFPHDLSSCLPTTQELASTLNDLLVSDPSLRGLPVYVSTDEDRPEELAEFGAMGWQVLDDAFLGSSERLGVFGPMMMDQVFMSQAQVLIGVRTSTFSKVGAYRQEDWYGRRAVLM